MEDGSGSNLVPGDPDPNGNIVGTAAQPIDPLLGSLANNGGPTRTLALLTGSPAIDAGTTANAPTKDQRGVTRGTPPDMGAYETQQGSLALSRPAADFVGQTTGSTLVAGSANDASSSDLDLLFAFYADMWQGIFVGIQT